MEIQTNLKLFYIIIPLKVELITRIILQPCTRPEGRWTGGQWCYFWCYWCHSNLSIDSMVVHKSKMERNWRQTTASAIPQRTRLLLGHATYADEIICSKSAVSSQAGDELFGVEHSMIPAAQTSTNSGKKRRCSVFAVKLKTERLPGWVRPQGRP